MAVRLKKKERMKRENPNQIKKLPEYSGCLTTEYSPVVFKETAFCFFVLLSDVPSGVCPTV